MNAESGKEWVRAREPQMQRLVGALVQICEAMDRAVGPRVRTARRQCNQSRRAVRERTAVAVTDAGAKLPASVREVSITAGVATGHAVTAVSRTAKGAVNDPVGAARALKRVPAAAAASVTRAVPGASRARDAAEPVVRRVSGAGKNAACDPSAAARQTADQLRTQIVAAVARTPEALQKAGATLRDPSALGAVAGAAAGKVMDAAAAGGDALRRGRVAARRAPEVVNEALGRQQR